ncbi:HAMP domain-containing histidine kinase [Colwellia sp. D2M02]|uniref:sensor histidine kinase n=1 Tax=Colwellia sp. D2M02 TaxID=2841562 RepID=UPI001C0929CC|nr:HAMP domain-containing sensor histidine kinase [Colwellia sp. D2M02]MBU2893521.1 HAMP domain-containing histidine kinase [Colwellia sp. D2M02]
MSSIVCSVFESISNSYGNAFFKSIALSLSDLLKPDQCIIASVDDKQITATTIINVKNHEVEDNFTYTLAGTPCAESTNEISYYTNNVSTDFPKDKRLNDSIIKTYLGTPIKGINGECIGILCVMYREVINNKDEIVEVFNGISNRLSAELNHLHDQQLLKNQLQTSEKMASLGSLVAGITHEVNTPLGIAITTHSILEGECQNLALHIKNQDLTLSAMNHYIEATESALAMQGENLERAKKLIENFKKTATDQHRLELENINVKDYYQKVISTLRALLKPQQITLTLECDDSILVKTYPGIHAQIITNLISNSACHGFSESNSMSTSNEITIEIARKSANEIAVNYRDNGAGLSDAAAQHVFEPFYTTARDKGGIGLGMSIISKLIKDKLQGDISVDNSGKGAHFIYSFKSE